MSQISISEYHCKSLLGEYLWSPYTGISVMHSSVSSMPHTLSVIKPDMKFGGRGKLGLLWVKLDLAWVNSYLQKFRQKQVIVKWNSLTLSQFLVEEFVPHDVEYYLAMDTNDRAGDTIYFSSAWWVEVENNWDQIRKILVPTWASIESLISELTWDSQIQQFISQIYGFFTTYGFTYLEFNPFVIVDGQIKVLDAVAKVDSCESYRQKQHRWPYELVDENYHYDIEKQIADADIKSWASMKLSLLNPDGAIWLILWGGGASTIIFDSLVSTWLFPHIANYGELSGNPSLDENQLYFDLLIAQMCKSSSDKLYLVVWWGIANFTDISLAAKALVSVLTKYYDILRSKDFSVIVRRWWINERAALETIEQYCSQQNIKHVVLWWDDYITSFIPYIDINGSK